MNYTKYLLVFLTSLIISTDALSQGLRFAGLEKPIDERTSYDVFSSDMHKFSGCLHISFDLALYPESAIGYILRVKDRKGNKVYNVFYDGQGDYYSFRLNDEGHSTLIMADMDKSILQDRSWINMSLDFDMKKDSVFFHVGDSLFCSSVQGLPEEWSPEINFGRSDYIIDVPSFAIRNLSVGDRKTVSFPLTEREGNIVHDSKGRAAGHVSNPVWMMNDFFVWEKLFNISSKDVSCSCYNPSRKEIYYFDRDTLHTYNLRTDSISSVPFANRCPVELALGTCFIDPGNSAVYAYEVWYDSGVPADIPTVARLDLNTLVWTAVSRDRLPMQMHHHGCFFDPSESRYMIFGGFGNMHYNGDFYGFDLHTGHWSMITGLTGDRICPRYFTSMGYDSGSSVIYVYGGMGNDSGEQAVGRRYLYDLYSVDLAEGKVRKLWETDLGVGNVVPVRNMYLDGAGHFYTLCYPESLSESALTLYKFSVRDGSFTTIADRIPIKSDRITTNANIFYDSGLEKMLALVYESPDDVSSSLSAYSLSLLPASGDTPDVEKSSGGGYVLWHLIAVLSAIAVASAVIIVKKKRKTDHDDIMTEPVPEEPPLPGTGVIEIVRQSDGEKVSPEPPIVIISNSIYLFGGFTAINSHGRDITINFTPMQQKMFCVLLSFSASGGISSGRLSALLWPDRQKESIKNLRNATLNHLRKSLSMLEGVRIIYENSLYRIETDRSFYCDYLQFMDIVSSEPAHENAVTGLVAILSRGKFLAHLDDICLDPFKSNVEQTIMVELPPMIRKLYLNKEYDKVLILADAIFDIDPMDETALKYTVATLVHLDKGDEAALKYSAFVARYKDIYNEEYPLGFDELLKF